MSQLLKTEPFHQMHEVDVAVHPTGVEMVNIHCDCGERTGWTSDPAEAWDAQAMHVLRETPVNDLGPARQRASAGLERGFAR